MTPITNLISKIITESATAEDFFAVSGDIKGMTLAVSPYKKALTEFGITVGVMSTAMKINFFSSNSTVPMYSLAYFNSGEIGNINHNLITIYNVP